MKRIAIEKMWEKYSEATLKGIPKESVQYRESKRIYFTAIADSLFTLRDIVGDDSVSEDDGEKIMIDMLDQIKKFLEREVQDFANRGTPAQPPSGGNTIVPRFRGNAIQNGKSWTWEAFITIGDNDPIDIKSKSTFISKEAALADMKDHSVRMLTEVCEVVGAPVPDHFIDLKEGKQRPFSHFKKKGF